MEQINTLPIWLQFAGPILVALIASIAGWLGLRRQLQKDAAEAEKFRAEAAHEIQESAVALIAPYQERLQALRDQIDLLSCQVNELIDERDTLKKRVKELEKGVELLQKQLREAGISPAWGNGKQESGKNN